MELPCGCDDQHTCFEKLLNQYSVSEIMKAHRRMTVIMGLKGWFWAKTFSRLNEMIRTNMLSYSGTLIFGRMRVCLAEGLINAVP